jgi:hypothetical protein
VSSSRYTRFRRALIRLRVEKQRFDQAVLVIQRWTRAMKPRYDFLPKKRELDAIRERMRIQREREMKAAIVLQKWTRSMKNRFAYLHLRQVVVNVQRKWLWKYERKRTAAIVIQRWTRSMNERFSYLHKKRVVLKIQRAWKEKYAKKTKAVLVLQKWTRAMKPRFDFLVKKRELAAEKERMRIQREREMKAAIVIQNWARSMKARFAYLHLKQVVVNVQQEWRVKYERKRNAAKVIQQWTRAMKERFEFLRLKRNVLNVQRKWKEKYAKKTKAVLVLQKWTRVMKPRFDFLVKKRELAAEKERMRIQREREMKAAIVLQKWTRSMKNRFAYLHLRQVVVNVQRKWLWKYERKRTAAIAIQRWTRAMKERFEFLHLKRITIHIQCKFKTRYQRLSMAALKIQHYYRLYKIRQYEQQEMARFNCAARSIQAHWRGYKIRKEINLEQLCAIRQRLSVYIQRPGHMTLGARIRRSLNTLQHSPSLQQVMTSLMDLKTVTRLSQECCITFTQSGTLDVLYEFISKCNRSKPHMDLIQLWLEILVNLAKCKSTCDLIIDSQEKLNRVLHLLQSYQSTNAQIFMNVCVLLIISASKKQPTSFVYAQLLNEINLKKIVSIYQTIERRAQLRVKISRERIISSSDSHGNADMSLLTNQTTLTAQNMSFTFEPEWSLCPKQVHEFAEPLAALQFLLCSILNVNLGLVAGAESQPGSLKTPSKTTIDCMASNSKKRMSTTKTIVSSKKSKTEMKPASAPTSEHSRSSVIPRRKLL